MDGAIPYCVGRRPCGGRRRWSLPPFHQGLWRARAGGRGRFSGYGCRARAGGSSSGGGYRRTDQAEPGRYAARDTGLTTIISARSGETEDITIVHLAVGWDAGQLKVGSFARSERMAKWNEALRIEEALGQRARFAGGAALGVRGVMNNQGLYSKVEFGHFK